jgi:hypothetical protein
MFDLVAEKYYCTTASIMAVPRVVEIVMAPEPPMCNTKHHGSQADAAIEKLIMPIVAEATHTGDRRLPGPHVVVPTPDRR